MADFLKSARDKLLKQYRFKFDVYGVSPIYAVTLRAYIKNPRNFLDAGIRLVPKKTADKKISSRGYFELFTPQIGAIPIARDKL